jgi:Fuc2NAc and GlcNAc transferase
MTDLLGLMVVVFVGAMVASLFFTWLVRVRALHHGHLDRPNARSSHTQPTPRGGGLAIVLTCLAGWIAAHAAGFLDASLLWALLPGGVAIATVGFIDDRRAVSPGIRFAVHAASAAVAVHFLQGLGPLHWGGATVSLGALGVVLAIIGVIWSVNLFNFMDGIDGIAGGQAVFMGAAVPVLTLMLGVQAPVAPAALLLASASLGFLILNWPPARIFMGDVGSGFIGFVIAVLAVAAARTDPVALWVWVVLGGLFIADATVTLLRRLARREAVHQAHRSHAYQHLSRRWGHRTVTLLFFLGNLFVVLPMALWVSLSPPIASWLALGFLACLCAVFAALGSGRRE